jgi:hypothetical protein
VLFSSQGSVRIVSHQKPDLESASWLMANPRAAAPLVALLSVSGKPEGGDEAAYGHSADIG